MSSVFPNLSKIPKNVSDTIKSRAGKNVTASTLMPWIRVIGSGGLVLESFQNKKDPENSETPEKNWSTDNFSTRYGNGSKSGRIGTDFNGNSVYADGNDRAYRPSPIIEALDVQNGNKGLSRKCTFTIKCFSLGQVEKISQYFLEPGYTVLVEFGWNTSKAKEQKLGKLSACNIALYNNFIHVNKKRKNSHGDYDAFLGYITGGGIKSGDGETYLCDVELTTLGEIPAYLQQHKGDSTKDGDQAGDRKYDVNTIEDDVDDKNIGLALFKQMFNRLPSAKQTDAVKALSNEKEKDKLGTPWISTHNYINMDDDIREELTSTYQSTEVTLSGAKGKIPQGAPLFSDQSFIRLELAFAILNASAQKIEAEKPEECTEVKKGYSYVIDTNSTICRAFPNMFSTDSSKLFIPNVETPDFGLKNVLTSTKAEKFLLPFMHGSGVSVFTGKTVNNNAAEQSQGSQAQNPNDYAFPARVGLKYDKTFETFNKIDSDVLEQNIDYKKWGYLRNLYINFDFFCDVISRSNVVTKDIYYEILNGISSAVNSFWYFEIVELCDSDGDNRLTVRDLSLVGLSNPNQLDNVDKFDSKGIKTPFLSSQLDFDIPGAMKNHVLGKRISEYAEVIKDGNNPTVDSLFAKQMDPVLNILNSLKLTDEPPQEKKDPPKPPSEDEIRKSNYDLFIGKATVISFVNDRNNIPEAEEGWFSIELDNIGLDQFASVACWNSTDAFTILSTNQIDSATNPILLPIKFEFEVIGVSGMRVGDLFKINDLPEKYKSGVFQIIETSHSIKASTWTTSVKAQFRQS